MEVLGSCSLMSSQSSAKLILHVLAGESNSNPLWKKPEQFSTPEHDAITDKKKSLSPSCVIGGKLFEQFCSTDRGNVSFANSSGVLVPHVHSQAQEVSHKP